MLSLKYAKEYRLDTFTDESGKVKDCTVYVGPLYEWITTEEVLKKLRLKLSVIVGLQAVLFVSSLWNYNDLSRLWWVVVPYACLLFVFLLQMCVCYNLFTVKGQFHREKKDKTVDRMKGCSVMGAILSGVSIVSATVSMIMSLVNIQFWDIYYIAVMLVMVITFIYCIRLSREIQVRELPNPKAEEWKNK